LINGLFQQIKNTPPFGEVKIYEKKLHKTDALLHQFVFLKETHTCLSADKQCETHAMRDTRNVSLRLFIYFELNFLILGFVVLNLVFFCFDFQFGFVVDYFSYALLVKLLS